MMRKIFVRGAVGLALVMIFAAASGLAKFRVNAGAATAGQFSGSQCVASVPRAWGEYKGGSAQSGLSFQDSAGTLRFVTNLPCGSTPTVALEIRRTGNTN
jgi:hypothetical protein